MKKAFLILLQFAIFFVVFLGGSLLDPLKLKWFVSHPTPTSTRFFVPDGLIFTVVLYLLLVLIEAAMKRFSRSLDLFHRLFSGSRAWAVIEVWLGDARLVLAGSRPFRTLVPVDGTKVGGYSQGVQGGFGKVIGTGRVKVACANPLLNASR